LPMSFGEAGQKKIVLVITGDGQGMTVEEKVVPCFQRLATLAGDWEAISSGIAALKDEGAPVWLEVLYQGDELLADLQERVRELTVATDLEVLRIKDLRLAAKTMQGEANEETLDDLEVSEVFGRCLLAHQIPPEQQEELMILFQETVGSLYDENIPKAGDGQP